MQNLHKLGIFKSHGNRNQSLFRLILLLNKININFLFHIYCKPDIYKGKLLLKK